jgi:hypothetical protein
VSIRPQNFKIAEAASAFRRGAATVYGATGKMQGRIQVLYTKQRTV